MDDQPHQHHGQHQGQEGDNNNANVEKTMMKEKSEKTGGSATTSHSVLVARHQASIQQLVQQQQLLASCLSSVLASSVSNPNVKYPSEEIHKAFEAQQRTAQMVSELVSLYRSLLMKASDPQIGHASSSNSINNQDEGAAASASASAGQNDGMENVNLPYRSPHDFDKHVRPVHSTISRIRVRTSNSNGRVAEQSQPQSQTPPLQQQQPQEIRAVPNQAQAEPIAQFPNVNIVVERPRRRTCRDLLVALAVVLNVRLAVNLAILVFVLGYDLPSQQLNVLIWLAIGYYLVNLGLVPNPFHVGHDAAAVVAPAAANNNAQGQQQPVQAGRRGEGFIMRQGRIPPPDRGGVLTDVWTLLITFVLSAIPGWRVMPVPQNPQPQQPPQQQQQQQQPEQQEQR